MNEAEETVSLSEAGEGTFDVLFQSEQYQEVKTLSVPKSSAIKDVLSIASKHFETEFSGISFCDVELDLFEPDAELVLHIGLEVAAGTLLARNRAKLRQLCVKLSKPELLVERRELKQEMDEFLQKAGSIAPTLLLVEMQNGTECGGVAGVAWPPEDADAKDPSKVSCIFSLGAAPTRFGLVRPDNWAIRSWSDAFGFGSRAGYDLAIL
jgi:hypothetical protein